MVLPEQLALLSAPHVHTFSQTHTTHTHGFLNPPMVTTRCFTPPSCALALQLSFMADLQITHKIVCYSKILVCAFMTSIKFSFCIVETFFLVSFFFFWRLHRFDFQNGTCHFRLPFIVSSSLIQMQTMVIRPLFYIDINSPTIKEKSPAICNRFAWWLVPSKTNQLNK